MTKHEFSDDHIFFASIRPLFRKRSYYVIAMVVCGIVSLTGTAAIIALPIGIFVLFKYAKTAVDIESAASRRFSEILEPIEEEPSTAKPALKGVMGSLGERRYLLKRARGQLSGYNVTLWGYEVIWKPGQRNGNYFRSYRVLELEAKHHFHHVFVDSLSNSRLIGPSEMYVLSKSLRKNSSLTVEGDVNRHFRIYVPSGHERQGLITLSPDKLLALRDYGAHFDIEFVENKIYLISRSKIRRPEDILMYESSVINLVSSLGQNISRKRVIAEKRLQIDEPLIIAY